MEPLADFDTYNQPTPQDIHMLFLAYVGGLLTILSPCILPIVPLAFSRADGQLLQGLELV